MSRYKSHDAKLVYCPFSVRASKFQPLKKKKKELKLIRKQKMKLAKKNKFYTANC